jgi:mono/diheme cytochrome c family protein
VLLAITSQGKVGLGLLAGLLIAFAILSAFYFPRRNPDFPGNRLGLFVLVSVLLFAGTMVGVVVFAKEEEGAHGAEAAETHPAETGETTTTTAEGATTGAEQGGSQVAGDPAAGKAVFESAGCVACHTLKAAGATGTVGPNLDEAKPDLALVLDRVKHGKAPMPPFEGELSEQQILDVAAFVVDATHG